MASDTEALKEEISQTREELGDTVEALAAKADVKARAQEAAERLRVSAQAGLATATVKASELGDRTKQAVQDPQNAGKVKGGGAAAAGTVVLGVVVWAVRRRRNRRLTRWEKAADVTRQAFDQAVGYGEAALRSDQAAKAVETGRRAARKAAEKGQELAPEATPRRKGTVLVVVGTAAGLVAYRLARRNAGETS